MRNLPAQNPQKGKLIIEKFVAPSLQGNHAGEDPIRRLTIYLPPGYEASNQRYPVIYFLHGDMDVLGDSLVVAWWRIHELMDAAILGYPPHDYCPTEQRC
ncbi:alpha/beta hydrolase-fold protein [Spirosoma flavum]|uniref:Alpha/beta hydrolase-fold protein n=1 Tax=Spirosoma flavum TaxID=2048557 RepID=A0ABW6APK6_9BACT